MVHIVSLTSEHKFTTAERKHTISYYIPVYIESYTMLKLQTPTMCFLNMDYLRGNRC